ncbi:MAG: ribonuclease Y [Endomicrobium sp.]|jgi:ribonuclease Y|nr:ribonuclease Y [Endomicrobium sp.]
MVNFIAIIIISFVSFILGFVSRFIYAKINVKATEQIATKIIKEAKSLADTKFKEALLEARIIVDNEKREFDKEIKERRSSMQILENRLNQREENLDKKVDSIDKKEKDLSFREKNIYTKEQFLSSKILEVGKIKDEQYKILRNISGMTKDEARKKIITDVENEVKQDIIVLTQRLEHEAQENAEKKAKEIISIAMQRISTEHAIDAVVSSINIPNDEIKGRIIGREGRNIRTFEQVTGVDLIVDDTPETITISSFDGVRRAIAKIALEKLISDGRIHPARIEEVVAKTKRDMDQHIKEIGERAVIDAGVPGLHPEIIKLLGKLKYRTSYGQNQLQHTLEVSWLAGAIASELRLDTIFCKTGGLLHDIGKAVSHEIDGSHNQISAEIAKKYGESPKMINAILSHHEGFERPKSAEAFVIAVSDAISASRPGARRDSIENYIKRIEKLEKVANSFDGILMTYAVQAGREVRVLVQPECIDDKHAEILAREIAKKIEQELEYPGQVKVTVIREIRAHDIAK